MLPLNVCPLSLLIKKKNADIVNKTKTRLLLQRCKVATAQLQMLHKSSHPSNIIKQMAQKLA